MKLLLTKNVAGVISGVKSHPDFVDMKEIYRQAHQKQFEAIIAIGGGSVMDAAKFISVYNKNKDYQFVEDLTKEKISKNNYKIIPVISIPTTAGTGSELTPYSTIWDMDEKQKYSLHLAELFSETAIYDPILTLSVPKNITIQTGLDALSHSLESIWNRNATQITVDFAVKSAKLILEYLVALSNDLDNLKYRSEIMKACMYSGMAFSNTQTAIAHAISYYITVHKGVPHGIACSFTLPTLIDNVIGKYSFIDNALIKIFGELSSKKIRSMMKELNINTEFKDYDITNNDLLDLKVYLQKNQRASNSLVNMEI